VIARAVIVQVAIGRVLLGTAARGVGLIGHARLVHAVKHHWSHVSSVVRAVLRHGIPSCPTMFCPLT
jgi:hypothetical protein